MAQLLGSRAELKQVSKNLARTFDEEPVLVIAVRKEGLGQGICFGRVQEFISGTPVWHPRVQRIQDHIPAALIQKLREVFSGRIVDNRGLIAILDLGQELTNQGRLSRAGIPDNQEVLTFILAGHPDD
jgi:hypothetical protein